MPDEGNQTTSNAGVMPAPSNASVPVMPANGDSPAASTVAATSPAPVSTNPVVSSANPVIPATPPVTPETALINPVASTDSAPVSEPLDVPSMPASPANASSESPSPVMATSPIDIDTTTPITATPVTQGTTPDLGVSTKGSENTPTTNANDSSLDLSDWLGSSTKTEEPKPTADSASMPTITPPATSPEAVPTTPSTAEVKVPITINPPAGSTPSTETTSPVASPLSDSYSGPHDITNQISGSEMGSAPSVGQTTPLGGSSATPAANLRVGNLEENKTGSSPVEKSSNLPLNEIYQQSAAKAPEPTSSNKQEATEDTKEGDSVIATLGEVLGIIGVIITALMLVSPVYSSMIQSIWGYVKLFGWLGAVGFLLVGFILSLFLKGNLLLKVFFCIALFIATVMYFGVNGSGIITSTLNNYLGVILTAYQ